MKKFVFGMLSALVLSSAASAQKKILAFVDVQNDFIDGSLAVGYENWAKAYENIESLKASGNFDTFVFTRDNHPVNHSSFKEFVFIIIGFGTKSLTFNCSLVINLFLVSLLNL